jgi:hypothetical protein
MRDSIRWGFAACKRGTPNGAPMRNTVELVSCLFVALIALISMGTAQAQSISTGSVAITSMGCGMAGPAGTAGSVCWVYISGPNVGPAACSTNSIRWDPGASPNGQVAVAQLTAAYLVGQHVSFVLYDTCWAEWPSYPTIWFYSLQ